MPTQALIERAEKARELRLIFLEEEKRAFDLFIKLSGKDAWAEESTGALEESNLLQKLAEHEENIMRLLECLEDKCYWLAGLSC